MPISNITSDYTGRLKDLFISQGVDPRVTGPQPVTYTFGKISSCVTGVQKLVQRYLVLLFNTGVARQLQSARAANVQEATHIFNFASWDVVQSLRQYQAKHPEIPQDEQLTSAQLMDISISGDTMHISVQLTTGAGESVPYVLPIAIA